MTYRELDEASNRLAHLLVGQGAGPGQCVALLFSRSAEAIVAIAGGAQDRGGLSADRPGAAGGPDRVHARRRRADRRDHHQRVGWRLDGHDLLVIDVDDPRIDTYPCTGIAGAGAR